MRRTVLAGAAGAPHDLVIDMRAVEFVSTSGMALLLGVRARQRARQRTLMLVCSARSATEQVLSRTGLRGDFTTTRGVP
jgi:anti-anti-sigma factor